MIALLWLCFAPLLSAHVPVHEERDELPPLVVEEGEVGARIAAWVRAAGSIGFSGAVLAARGGEVVCAVGAGSADARGREPIDPATLFEIASVTKPFTALAAVRLAREGKLGLDDSIAEHLPRVPEDCRAITVRHLIQHTSGIPGTNSEGRGTNVKVVLPLFLEGGPRHEPGTHFEYWNQGYALLSEIIARAADEPYVDFCRRSIFEPAGMASTCFTGDKAPKGATVAVGRSEPGDRSALDPPYGAYGFEYRGMGGIVTSVQDLWRFDRALRGDVLLDERWKRAVFEPGLEEYGLGWYVRKSRSGRLRHEHSGAVRGFRCDVRRYPEEDGCLFVLCNTDEFNATRAAQALEELLFEEGSSVLLPPAPLDEREGKALAGTYELGERRMVIEAEDGFTRVRIHWGERGRVTYAFLGLDEEERVVFWEWRSVTPVELDRRGRGKVRAITIGDDTYRRER